MNELDKIMKKIDDGRQYRRTQAIEIRKEEDDPKSCRVEGYATTFNEEYMLYNFGDYRVYESVDPNAFDECDISDVIMQYNHEGRVFARTSNGTLKLTCDDHGLLVEAELGGTEIGRQLYEEISGGFTNKMSFGFTVDTDERTVESFMEDGIEIYAVHRVIKKIGKLYDVSAVSIPANDGTEISARSYCDGVIAEIEAERLKAREEAEARSAQIQRIKILAML